MLDIQSLPVGVALPLLDCIRHCREAPPITLPLAVYDLIGRTDLGRILSCAGTIKTPCLEDSENSDGISLDLEVSGRGSRVGVDLEVSGCSSRVGVSGGQWGL